METFRFASVIFLIALSVSACSPSSAKLSSAQIHDQDSEPKAMLNVDVKTLEQQISEEEEESIPSFAEVLFAGDNVEGNY